MRKIDPFKYGIIEKDDINQQAVENYFGLIEQAESFYESQIKQVVEAMSKNTAKADIICLSGPSASGKTTTAYALKRNFISCGRKARVISLDDFYLDVDKAPKAKDGQPDLETIYALDVDLINHCIEDLVKNGRTLVPVFNFQTKHREQRSKEVTISENEVVIIEGIHGLNPMLTELVGEGKVTKIYASARSKFVDRERVILTPKDVRLMRRMVRDVTERNTQPEDTVAMWDAVCDGEREFVNPYRDGADYKLDTTLDYEPNIFHSYLKPFLDRVKINPFLYKRMDDLYQKLDEFFDINDITSIPENSVVREFIGSHQPL